MGSTKAINESIVTKAEKALKEAVINVIRDHRQTGDPVIVWRGGKVVKADAKKLLARAFIVKMSRYGAHEAADGGRKNAHGQDSHGPNGSR